MVLLIKKEKSVLELGAGAALPSIISSFCGAKLTVVTDYNESAIVENMKKNIAKRERGKRRRKSAWVYLGWKMPEKFCLATIIGNLMLSCLRTLCG